MDLFKGRTGQFDLDSIMNIPIAETGAVNTVAQTIVGMYYWNANLSDYKNLLTQFHLLTLDQVHAFSVWFIGYELSSLATSSHMNINAVETNVSGNLSLVNQYKIQLQ